MNEEDYYITIDLGEVKRAMKKMGKNKAPSVDGMMDTIFQEEEWLKAKPSHI